MHRLRWRSRRQRKPPPAARPICPDDHAKDKASYANSIANARAFSCI